MRLLVFVFIFAFVFPSPSSYSMRPAAIQMSPELRDKIRSELRSASSPQEGWSDYHQIPDPAFKNLVLNEELQIQDKYLKVLSLVLLNTVGEKEALAIDSILLEAQDRASRIEKDRERKEVVADAIEKIKRVLNEENAELYLRKVQRIEDLLNKELKENSRRTLFELIESIFEFKLIFEGIPFTTTSQRGKPFSLHLADRVYWLLKELRLGESVFDRMVPVNCCVTLVNLEDTPGINLNQGKEFLDTLQFSPRRRIVTGILFYYDLKEAPFYEFQYQSEKFRIPNQPVWVLSNGFLVINVKKMLSGFDEASQAIIAAFNVPQDFVEGLKTGKYEILPPKIKTASELTEKGYEDFAGELAETKPDKSAKLSGKETLVYDYGEVRDPKVKKLIFRRENSVNLILERGFKIYFSGFSLDGEDDLVGDMVRLFMETVPIDHYFQTAQAGRDDTIALIDEDPEDAAHGRVKINLKKVPYKYWRVPITSILFFSAEENALYHSVQIEGKSYDIPVRAPLWTFREGLLAINVTNLSERNVKKILNALFAALRIPPDHSWEILPRSEVRSQNGTFPGFGFEDLSEDEEIKEIVREKESEAREFLLDLLVFRVMKSGLKIHPVKIKLMQWVVKLASQANAEVEESLEAVRAILGLDFLIIPGVEESAQDLLEYLSDQRPSVEAKWKKAKQELGQMPGELSEKELGFYENLFDELRSVLSFKLIFSGFTFKENARDSIGDAMRQFLKTLKLKDFFDAASFGYGDVSIPLLENIPEEDLSEILQKQPERLKELKERIPLTGIVFFRPLDEAADYRIEFQGHYYVIPAKFPVWTFANGLLAIRIGESKTMYGLLTQALNPSKSIHHDLFPRSEVRSTVKIPAVPDIDKRAARNALASLGVAPHREGLLLDASLFKTSAGMAIALAIFSKAEIPYVVVGLDESDPWIISVNKALAEQGERAISVALDAAGALALLKKKIHDEISQRGGMLYGFHTRAILSSSTGINAESLRKQLEISVMTPSQFTQNALGIADRLGISSFVEQLQKQAISQLQIAHSA